MLSTKKEKERSVARAADLSAERSRAIFFNATTYHPSAFLVTRVSGWSPIDRLELRIYTVHGWWMKHAIQWNADYKIVGLGALDARVMIRRFSIVLRCPPYIYGVWNGFVGRGGRTGILPDKWNMFRFGCLCALTRCHKIYIFILYFEKNEILFVGNEKTWFESSYFQYFYVKKFSDIKIWIVFFFFFIWYNW